MSSKKPKATRKRMISCFAQIVQEHIPGWKIEQIAAGEKVKARKFSYSSQVYLLMLSQFLHLFSLNEIVDVSKIYAPELSRLRGVTPASLNTFSNANRTRDPKVMQSFFWVVYDIFRRLDEGCGIIATSNISSIDRPFDYVFSYETLRDEDHVIEDNALIMALKALCGCGVKKVTLAGFDGFSAQNADNYFDEYMQNSADFGRLQQVNEAVREKLKAMSGDIRAEFLTPSLYES